MSGEIHFCPWCQFDLPAGALNAEGDVVCACPNCGQQFHWSYANGFCWCEK
jgi:hypothetical protein